MSGVAGGAGAGVAKKPAINIKPFRTQVQMDPNYAEKTWTLLRNAICEIHKQNASCLSFEELYRNAYNMVLHKYGDKLYKGLQEVVEEHLRNVAEVVASTPDDVFLITLNKVWSDHKVSQLMIRDILMYMDRVYVLHQNIPCVYDLGLQLFRDKIARAPRIKDRIRNLMLATIYRERTGEVVDRSVLKNVTQMLIDLGISSHSVYEKDFEQPFLEATADFYKVESQEFITSNNCSDYLKKAEHRIREEMDRVAQYLDNLTQVKLMQVVEQHLLTAHMRTLLETENSGLVYMLKNDKIDDLQRMYSLLSRVGEGLALMRTLMVAHIKETGSALVTDVEKCKNSIEFVQNLIDFKDKYDLLLDRAFSKDKSFIQAVNQTFESVININAKSPEFLSLFIDEKLKKGLKGVTDEEIDIILDKVIVLFRFLQDKDVFEKYYKQHLAKRLLLGRSVSDDAERAMIAKLKSECGYQVTSKLEGMFTDMKVSADTMEGFRRWLETTHRSPKLELNVNVLTAGYWPAQLSAPARLPSELQECCNMFTEFYMLNRNGRRLTWQANVGTAEVKAMFLKKHELSVTTYQMLVLLQFNEQNKMTFSYLQESSGIPVPDLRRALMSLSCGKAKILLKTPMEKVPKINETDAFTFNSAFKSNLYRVKILAVLQKETVEESADTRQKVEDDRKHLIEAAIVRTMKARKTMTHNQLIAEVTTQLSSRFMPNPVLIKKRIESLLEREYLARDATNRTVYNYLA
ncbi:cullin C [Pelomyxa schiedti]|nr:cullin C [Pelomyxa schiedti]